MLYANLTKWIYNPDIQIQRNNGNVSEAHRLCLKTLLHHSIADAINGKKIDFDFFNLPSIYDLAEEELQEYMKNYIEQYRMKDCPKEMIEKNEKFLKIILEEKTKEIETFINDYITKHEKDFAFKLSDIIKNLGIIGLAKLSEIEKLKGIDYWS